MSLSHCRAVSGMLNALLSLASCLPNLVSNHPKPCTPNSPLCLSPEVVNSLPIAKQNLQPFFLVQPLDAERQGEAENQLPPLPWRQLALCMLCRACGGGDTAQDTRSRGNQAGRRQIFPSFYQAGVWFFCICKAPLSVYSFLQSPPQVQSFFSVTR